MKTAEKYNCYLQHNLKFIAVHDLDEWEGEDYFDGDKFKKGSKWELVGFVDKKVMLPMGETEVDGFIFLNGHTCINANILNLKLKPILKPLDAVIEEISSWIWSMEPESFDTQESAKSWCEIMFIQPEHLPYYVFDKVCSLHGDVFSLIEKGLAVKI